MGEFNDMPAFAGRSWRELTRWLQRNDFIEGRAQIIGGDTSVAPGHTMGSSVWFRRRAGLRTEAVRIDVLGHRPSGHSDLERSHPMKRSVVVERTGFGDVRHFHKESINPSDEASYLLGPVPGRITYDDNGVVIANNDFGRAHIPIQP